MTYIQLQFSGKEPYDREILTALLTGNGAYAFEEKGNVLIAWFNKENFIREHLESVFADFGYPEISEVEEENWNAKWESSFEPVTIPYKHSSETYAVVRAPFHPDPGKTVHDVVITPKMSFGTGHHATTFMMIKEMSDLDFKNKTVFDFGTGTGVLSIIAANEGADVIAIDNDEKCIANASENFLANNCEVNLAKMESVQGLSNVDIVLANINRNVIIDNLGAIKKMLKPGGHVLFSGLLHADKTVLLPLLMQEGFNIQCTDSKDQWLMIHACA